MSLYKILFYLVCPITIWAQGSDIFLSYNDLIDLVEKSSPEYKQFLADQEMVRLKSASALQWENPDVNIVYETVQYGQQQETEQNYLLSKSFDMPWIYRREKSIWNNEVEFARLNVKHNKNELLVHARYGYVRLYLLSQLRHDFDNIRKLFEDLYLTIEARQQEGALSVMEASLIEVSLLSIHADQNRIEKELREFRSHWLQLLGIDPATGFRLSSKIEFKMLDINDLEQDQLLANHPGLQARKLRLTSFNQRINLEQMKLFPLFTVQGGYKKIDTDWEGYVIGLSMPLPLLNWNRPQVEQQKVNRQMQEIEVSMYRRQLLANMQNLLSSIRDGAALLKQHNDKPNYSLIDNLLAAYQEGMMSLTDFLNAVQLFRDGSIKYAEQLAGYYQSVFKLEALAGQQFVNF